MTYRNQKKLSTAMQGSRSPFFENEEHVASRSCQSTMLFVQSSLLNLPLAVATPEGLHISPSAIDGF